MGERLLEVRRLPARLVLICSLSAALAACDGDAQPFDDAGNGDDDSIRLDDLELETDEDTAVTGTLDASAGSGSLELAIEAPRHGTLTRDGMSVTYTPEPDFHGEERLRVTATSASGSTAGLLHIIVAPVNDAPVAVDDLRAATEDAHQAFEPAALLANDGDVDGDVLTITAVDTAVGGTVAISGAQVLFTNQANFTGVGSFRYTVSDGVATATATVSIDFDAVNDAPVASDDIATTAEDTAVEIPAVALLDNDSDIDTASLSIASVGGAVDGTVALAGNTITFTPAADFVGDARFTYVVTDGALTDTGAVVVTIGGANDAPVAGADTATTAEDAALDIAAAALLADDDDVDGDTLDVIGVGAAAHGQVALAGTNITFTPDANYHGAAGFEYTIADGNGGTATGTVAVTVTPVNDAPVADDDTATATEDLPALIAGATLVPNDDDIDGDTLAVSDVSNATNGTVSLSGGTITFQPAADYNGAAGFDYTVSDGAGGTDVGHVSITVGAINDAPVADDDGATATEDSPASIAAGDVLDGDADIDGGALSVTAASNATNGSVSLSGTTITFTPAADFNGTAGFDYTVSDGAGGSDIGHVTVTVSAVNDAPVAVDDATTTLEDVPAVLAAATLATNDTDVDGDPRTVTATTNATGGSVTLVAGTITFTPTANSNGTAGFDYTVSDGAGGTDTGHVTVTVSAVNDAPVATDDALAASSEDSVRVIAGASVTGNDSDLDGNPLTVTDATNATGGTVTVSGGSVTFTPTANYNGPAGFDYTVSDGAGGTDVGHATFTINPVNDNPVANTDTATVAEDGSVAIDASNLLTNDTDPEGDTPTFTGATSGANGTVSVAGTTITFTPAADFSGAASFTYAIADGNGGTASGTVDVTVTAVNDAPVAVDDTRSVVRDFAAAIPTSALLANDTDVDGSTRTVTGVSNPTNGTVSLAGTTVTFTSSPGFVGAASFDYAISDGAGGTDTGHVAVTVLRDNLSFETEDYMQWVLTENGGQTCGIFANVADGQAVTPPISLFDFADQMNVDLYCPGLTTPATNGDRVAFHGQNCAEQHRMSIDLDLPSTAIGLEWDMMYNNTVQSFNATQQFIAVHLRDPNTDAILTTLFKTTEGVDADSIPMTAYSADISAYAGQTVRLDVELQIQIGCFPAAFDNFHVVTTVPDLTFAPTASNCVVAEHNGPALDDRGGIAIGATRLLYNGDGQNPYDGSIGVYDPANLGGGVDNGVSYGDFLFSDLATGQVFVLGNGATPLDTTSSLVGNGTVTSLIEIDEITGAIIGQVNLSAPIAVTGQCCSGAQQTGIFAGAGRVVLLATPDFGATYRVYDIETATGAVTDLGPMASFARVGCENAATWGVATTDGVNLYINYTNNNAIEQRRVPDGAVSTLAQFTNLSDMCAFTVQPSTGRWYFHYEGTAQFRSGDETIGYCDASFCNFDGVCDPGETVTSCASDCSVAN